MFALIAQAASQPSVVDVTSNWPALLAGTPILAGLCAFIWKVITLLDQIRKDSQDRYETFAERMADSYKESTNSIVSAIKDFGTILNALRDTILQHKE